jgi:asparagine synthetase B (glutamine-hydrolysing)
MCGLLTWLSRARPIDGGRLNAGLSALRHRGPDALGMMVLEVPTQRSSLVKALFVSERSD